jgi:hypothetical protein
MDEALIIQPERYTLFKGAAVQIARFFDTRRSPVPVGETIEIVRVLEVARRERGTGRVVDVGS